MLKTVLIGCGRMGFSFDNNKKTDKPLSHFSAINADKNFKLEAVTDIDSNVLKCISSSNSIKTYTNHLQLLENHNPDVITIATPDNTHYQIAIDVLNSRPKLVLIEKPLANNSKEINEAVRLYNSCNIPLMVNYSRRFFEPFISWKKLILENTLNIKQITCHYTGGLLHNGIHFIDLICYLLGVPELVNVFSNANNFTPSFELLYKENSLSVYFIGLKDSPASVEEFDVFHEFGRFRIDNHGIKKYEIIDDQSYPGFKVYGNEKKIMEDSNSALIFAYQNIFDFLENNAPLISPAEESVATMKIVDQIFGKT